MRDICLATGSCGCSESMSDGRDTVILAGRQALSCIAVNSCLLSRDQDGANICRMAENHQKRLKNKAPGMSLALATGDCAYVLTRTARSADVYEPVVRIFKSAGPVVGLRGARSGDNARGDSSRQRECRDWHRDNNRSGNLGQDRGLPDSHTSNNGTAD